MCEGGGVERNYVMIVAVSCEAVVSPSTLNCAVDTSLCRLGGGVA